ncbi:hypothetical protein GOV12_07685 [Candidatus Pacearchaeota archaeon]|nr:hypothetical protein [Candidatus Pacearchaeota archaeon]
MEATENVGCRLNLSVDEACYKRPFEELVQRVIILLEEGNREIDLCFPKDIPCSGQDYALRWSSFKTFEFPDGPPIHCKPIDALTGILKNEGYFANSHYTSENPDRIRLTFRG